MKKYLAKSSKAKRPNLFIVGSMKCGTTILFDFLTSHDEISGGTEKECHYFSLNHEKGELWYTEKFSRSSTAKYYLDASPTYMDMCLTHPTAERIKQFSPDAKIIILIRNPISRAISHYNHLKKINAIPELKDLSFDDLMGRRWDDVGSSASVEGIRNLIVNFSRYELKINKFIELFGKERVLVVHNDDMRNEGDIVLNQVFEFLELSAPQGVDFTQKRYMHGSEKVIISKDTYIDLLMELGDDYYKSCRVIDAIRPISPDGKPDFNQPIGTLVNEVAVGADGWLFLATGSNNAVEMFIEDEETHLSVCQQWHKIVQKRRDEFSKIGARYIHMMLPEKLTILGEKLQWPFEMSRSRGKTFNHTAPAEIRPCVIDLISYFSSLPEKSGLFFKTDSHWNHVGAFVAYQLTCAIFGFAIRPELIGRPKSMTKIKMDLGGKLPDEPMEDAIFAKYRQDSILVSDDGLVAYKRINKLENEGSLHTGSYVHFRNDAAPNKERIVIFGDSFSEYRDHLLTALMAETFAETVFIWSANIDYKFCEEFKPDIVFCFMTERFMSREPDDTFDWRSYTKGKLNSLRQG